jgi:hypothetical protein
LFVIDLNISIRSINFHSRQNRGITLYPCVADNDSELSFHANEIVTHSKFEKNKINLT